MSPSISQALDFAKQLLHEPRSGEILLGSVLKQSRAYLYAWPEKALNDDEWMLFQDLIKQREQGLPIAYLVGEQEFYSLRFKVTPDTLIPRPETEMLVDKTLDFLPAHEPCHILELGTGSGAIAVTLAHLRPSWHITACDISLAALGVAKENAKTLGVQNITFIQSNWYGNIPQQNFHLIVSNPPYIAQNDPHLLRGDVRFEPQQALIAGDGLLCLDSIINNAPKFLLANAWVLVEHGYDQQQAVQYLFAQAGFTHIQTLNDLAQLPRLTFGQKSC